MQAMVSLSPPSEIALRTASSKSSDSKNDPVKPAYGSGSGSDTCELGRRNGSTGGREPGGLPAGWRLQATQPTTDQTDEAVCTDFFNTACGLLLGSGLTSVPLYPDMMTFVHHWLPRRMGRAIRSRADPERLKRLSWA